MGSRYDVRPNQFSYPVGRFRPGINCSLYASNISLHEDGQEPSSNLHLLDQVHVGGLGHRVGGLHVANVAFCFN